MSGVDFNDIDWSDPIAANRQLKAQLAELEEKANRKYQGTRQVANQNEVSSSDYNSQLDYNPDYYSDLEDVEDAPSMESKSTWSVKDKSRNRRNLPKRRTLKSKNMSQPVLPKRRQRANLTFGDRQCREIDRANLNLLKRLSSIHNRNDRRGESLPMARRKVKKKKRGSAALNNRRKMDKIAQENRRFAERLQRVRSTKSLSRSNLKKHAKKSRRYAALGQEVRAPTQKMKVLQRREREWQ